MTPQFRALTDAFDARRAALNTEADEIDPELVLVFDLAGSVSDFRNAAARIKGLEFLTELIDKDLDSDDEFHQVDNKGVRQTRPVPHSLQLVMSNATAVNQLLSLFGRWQADEATTFDHGLGRFKALFAQLIAVRRWGPEDRVRETGLLEQWQEHLAFVGQSVSTVLVEVELWYRRTAAARQQAQRRVEELVRAVGGQVKAHEQLDAIAYHALLVELPVQQVRVVLERGAGAIELLTTDQVMLVSPYEPMVASPPDPESVTPAPDLTSDHPSGLPRIALLDGLPAANHDLLAGRVIIDDPDGLGERYPVSQRQHGTAMASLIIHGDVSAPGKPLDRPLYARPILQPEELVGGERLCRDVLFVDLLHRAVRRIVEADGTGGPVAPSVRVVNLSIGAPSRALVRRMSPAGRLLDWLAREYNLLFIVSAGNHNLPVTIPADAASNLQQARAAALEDVRRGGRLRGILPPGDALNVLTVGATHHDSGGDLEVPDTAWDLVRAGTPAFYGAVGPGVGRSVKPDVHHAGGRVLYGRPVPSTDSDTVALLPLGTPATGPGTRVAAVDRRGGTSHTAFTSGTSNAAALMTRAASSVFDVLEEGAEAGDPRFPDAQFHPVLVRALLTHASSWGTAGDHLRAALDMTATEANKVLPALLGYGVVDQAEVGRAAVNRAVLIGAGAIAVDQQHTYELPLPASLRARNEWHRITVTLAYLAPTAHQLTRYRGTKLFVEGPLTEIGAGSRADADQHVARRGSCQHEVFEGRRPMVFGDGETLPLTVASMQDGRSYPRGTTTRYGLVVSIQTRAEVSTTIHDEVRAQLRARVAVQDRTRIT